MAALRDKLPVAFVGPYPPPYGGVAIHIRRLAAYLAARGHPVTVYCQPLDGQPPEPSVRPVMRALTWYYWLVQYSWRAPERIVHFHYGWGWAPAMLFTSVRNRRVFVTFHSEATGAGFAALGPADRQVARMLLRRPTVTWIAVSEPIRDQLLELGVDARRVHVIPAFLPPSIHERAADQLPDAIREFLESHEPILATYAYRLRVDEGTDVYGLDMALEATRRLHQEFSRIGLLIVVPWVDALDYLERLQGFVGEHGLEDSVMFHTEPLEAASAAWESSDVFIRATTTDGDSVSVREALEVGTQVVASDSTFRPEGCVLFRSRDVDSLAAAIRRCLVGAGRARSGVGDGGGERHAQALVELYEEAGL